MTMTLDGTAGMTAPQGAIYNGLQTGTSVSASGTSVDFTGIPVWVKRITIMFNNVSTNGGNAVGVQMGSGAFQTTGYTGNAFGSNGGASGVSNLTSGIFCEDNGSATYSRNGTFTLTLQNATTNSWASTAVIGRGGNNIGFGAGSVSLSGVLDRVRITTVAGTDTFDAGSINIMYE